MDVEAQSISNLDVNLCDVSALSCRNYSEFRNSEVVVSSEETEEILKFADRSGENGGDYEEMDDKTDAYAVLERCSSDAAMKLQKAYRGYRTRRMLADSAVVAEELWWQVLDFARLNHSTISFFNFAKPETAASRWNRISLNASKVGKGLSADAKAQKLAFQHWIEAIDPRHRYGHSLHYYFDAWSDASSGQPFFYWLDIGDGKEVDLKECPRSKLRKQCIKYLGQKEREHYEVVVIGGKISFKLTGKPLDTNQGSRGAKWIFVMSTSKRLYVGEKQKGLFHHSSFLAGGATLASGRLIVEGGLLKSISAYSGHYKPTDESLDIFLSFLNENGVNLDEVKILKGSEDPEKSEYGKLSTSDYISCDLPNEEEDRSGDFIPCDLPNEEEDRSGETTEPSEPRTRMEYKRSLSGGLRSPKTDVPHTTILQRINSKKSAKSYQLGHQLPTKWSTGTGPRIGCIADYPVELRLQALELTNLSPRTSTSTKPWTPRRIDYLSPRSSAPGDLGNIDAAAAIDLKL